MATANLTLDRRGGVAWITISRPAQFNALDLATMEELLDVANRLATDSAVRAVVLTGAGDEAFCAGGDVAGFAAAGEDGIALLVHRMTAAFHMAISRLAWMRAPVVAAVNGVAAGAGLSLVAACDLVVAAEGAARFTSAYTRIGLTPDGSSTFFLTRILGPRRATELHMTDRVLTAREALDWGLVNRVVPDGTLLEEAGRLAAGLAEGPTRAYGGVKRLVQTGLTDSLESQMERESRFIAEMAGSADGAEGIRAFVEKRKPRFTGA